jgi:hypothetical protein
MSELAAIETLMLAVRRVLEHELSNIDRRRIEQRIKVAPAWKFAGARP